MYNIQKTRPEMFIKEISRKSLHTLCCVHMIKMKKKKKHSHVHKLGWGRVVKEGRKWKKPGKTNGYKWWIQFTENSRNANWFITTEHSAWKRRDSDWLQEDHKVSSDMLDMLTVLTVVIMTWHKSKLKKYTTDMCRPLCNNDRSRKELIIRKQLK